MNDTAEASSSPSLGNVRRNDIQQGHPVRRGNGMKIIGFVFVIWGGWFAACASYAAIPIDSCRAIRAPGSYEVISNITAAGDCIVIDAMFVTIDLGGHVLQGNARTGKAIAGGSGVASFATVRNGSIRDFASAIDLTSALGTVVEKVGFYSNPVGIKAGRNSAVRDNVFLSGGISVGHGSLVSGNVLHKPFGWAAIAAVDSSVTGNVIYEAVTNGIWAVGGIVSDNTVEATRQYGMVVDCPAVVRGNTAQGNYGAIHPSSLIRSGPSRCEFVNNVWR